MYRCDGCHAPSLGPSAGLRLSSSGDDPCCAEQGQELCGGGDHPDRPILANEGVVLGSVVHAVGASDPASVVVGSAPSTSCQKVPSEVVRSSSSCVETLQRHARAAGFSARVARQLGCFRKSSLLVAYQSKWPIFRRWCWDKGHSSSNPSVPKIADFLLWLWQKNLSLSAVKAYRSMLSLVFAFKLPSLSDDPSLRSLIRSFAIERPRSPGGPPSWDLDKVLRHLMSSAYEPLESQGLRTLTKKVLFLVALAAAKRVSELQPLSRVVPSTGDALILSYIPFFVAKTESPSNPLPRSFRLKALSDFAHGLEESSLLCPVRALHIYLLMTKGLARRSSALFVFPRVPSRSISKNALSFFLWDVIIDAGAADVVSGSSVRAQ